MASKNPVMSDRARKALMEMNAMEKAVEDAQNKQTFDGIISFLKVLAVIITVAGVLYNYSDEVGKYFDNPTSASASSAEKK